MGAATEWDGSGNETDAATLAAEIDARPAGACYCDLAGWCAVCDEARLASYETKEQS